MQPSVSIIIPVYNDPEGLKETLDCLVSQAFPRNQYEIIVIDNASTDNTSVIGENYARQFNHTIRFIVENKVQGSYAARNKGIEFSRGEILIFIDANITVGSDYIEKVSNRFNKTNVDYLGCNVKMIIKKPSISSAYNFIHGFNVENSIRNENYTPTSNLVIRREIINKVGTFDSRLESGGDFEFGERVHSASFVLNYADDIILYHPTRSNYKSLINKARRIGRGNAEMAFHYPKKYNYLMQRHVNVHAFLPKNPLTYFFLMKNEKILKRLFCSILFPFYHIPLQLSTTIECIKTFRELTHEES